MAEVVLAAEVGRPLGPAVPCAVCGARKIPGVIYGHGTEPVPIAVVARELRVALNTEAGANQLLSLETGAGNYPDHRPRDAAPPHRPDGDPRRLRHRPRDEVISVDVPITLVGEALEVHHGDGLVEQQMFTLPIRGRSPGAIPTVIEADISELTIGGQVRVSDISLPEGVTTETDPETAIAIGQPPRVVTLEEEAAEVEGEEGAAAEPRSRAGRRPRPRAKRG